MKWRRKVTDIRPDSLASEKYGFEPFGTLAGVLSGEPVKIMPLGKFFRDERILDITEADLQEIALNFNAKLPRFRVPINENHQTDGKIGTVKAVEFRKDGADGAGLYASLDLTDDGKDLLQRGRYDAVSPEMVWQKNGASYQDPQTGKRFSNVLVGLAVCDKPFFSHEHVALFTAFPDQYREFTPEARKALADSGAALPDGSYPIVTVADLANAIQAVGRATNRAQVMAHIKKRARALGAEDRLPPEWMADHQPGDTPAPALGAGVPMDMDKPKRHNGYTKLRELMKAKFDELMAMVKDEDGDGELDMPMMPDMPAAKKMGSHPAADRAAAIIKGVETMTTAVTDKAPPATPDLLSITPEQFAEFTAAKSKAEALATQVTAQSAQIDAFAAQLATEKRAHRLGEWRQTVKETFTALGVKVDEMAEKFLAIEEQSPELAKYFVDLLKQADTAMAQAALFGQVTHTGGGSGNVESFADLAEKILADKYDGDTSKVTLAQAEARKQRPDLFREWQMSYSPRSKRG